MERKRKVFGAFAFLCLLSIISCATGKTTLTSVWKNENYQGGRIKKVLIIGAAEKHQNRKLFEDEFATRLSKKGIRAVRSYTVIPAEKMLDRETIVSKVKELNVDSVLVTRLRYRETASQDYPGGKAYVKTPGYYDDYGAYVTRSFSMKTPVEPNQLVHLETNVYETKNEERIWSALSSTFVEGAPKREIRSFIETMINRLSDDRLLD